jgi:PAS domain S-box-containing protein
MTLPGQAGSGFRRHHAPRAVGRGSNPPAAGCFGAGADPRAGRRLPVGHSPLARLGGEAHYREAVSTDLEEVDLLQSLDPLGIPSYVIDREGTLTWLNAAARRLLGDVAGQSFRAVVAPDYQARASEQVARKLLGARATDFELEILDAEGRRVLAEISSVSLKDDQRIVGIFGLLNPVRVQEPPGRISSLTPRQTEVLRLLADGASTAQVESELHVTRETVRNHIRAILRALGAHSRLEAVAIARRRGLLDA